MERLGGLIFQTIWSVKFGVCQLTWVKVQGLWGGWRKSSSLGTDAVTPGTRWFLLGTAHWEDTTEGRLCARGKNHSIFQICQWQVVCTLRACWMYLEDMLNVPESQFPCQSNGAINRYLIKFYEDDIICEHPLEQALVQTQCSANLGFIICCPC